jgi:DNA polymerase-1
MNNTTIIVDGNSLWWRTYKAANELRYGGEFKFLEIIANLKRTYRASQVLIAWDSWCQWRRDLYPLYKAHRNKPDRKEDQRRVYAARDEFIHYLQHFVPNYFAVDAEGDDVIAKLLQCIPGNILIYGNDHDFQQLLSDKVSIIRPRRRTKDNFHWTEHITNENLEEKEGYPPEYVIWLLAICGDSSDNLPGCRVPKKKVVELLNRVYTLDNVVLSRVAEVARQSLSPGWLYKLERHLETQAEINLQLVTLPPAREIRLLSMYHPNLRLADEYLISRVFHPIRTLVHEQLLCNFSA